MGLEEEPKISPESESEEFSRSRFNFLLALLAIFLIGIVIAGRSDIKVTRGASVSMSAFQGDISIKTYYASEFLSKAVNATFMGSTASTKEMERNMAIKFYKTAIAEDPSTSNYRHLLIIDTPADRPALLNNLGATLKKHATKSKAESEMAMWTAIYSGTSAVRADQVKEYSAEIRGLNLGWYQNLALSDMYARAGMRSRADAARSAAASSAAHTLGWLFGVSSVITLLGIVGLGIILWYIMEVSNGRIVSRSPISAMEPARRNIISGVLLEVFILYLFLVLFVGTAAGGALDLFKHGSEALTSGQTVGLTVLVYLLSSGLAFLYLVDRMRVYRISWEDIGLKTKEPGRDILWGIGGYAAALPLVGIASYLANFLNSFIRTPENPVVPLFVESHGSWEQVVLFLLAAVAAPFFEETFFRGVLFNSFRARWGFTAGVVLSAFVFGMVHPLPQGLLPIFMLGCVFAILTNFRGSLLSNMVAHGLNNAVSFVLLLILARG
jgi:hypothetical protein